MTGHNEAAAGRRRLAGLFIFGLASAFMGGGFVWVASRPPASVAATGGICAGSSEPITLREPPAGLAPYETQAWRGDPAPALDYAVEDGRPVWRDTTGTYPHPGNVAQVGIRAFVNGDRETAEAMADQLAGDADFPWLRYDFALTMGPVDLEPGWVSGMDQGQALALFSMLGQRENADAVFATLREGSPVVWTDNRDYWIEEYPSDPPDHVINGHIFGLFGLREYWSLTGSAEAEELLVRGIETTRRWMPVFLTPDRIEYDTARTGRGILGSYYQLYIEQFSVLAAITGEPCFDEAARFVAAHP